MNKLFSSVKNWVWKLTSAEKGGCDEASMLMWAGAAGWVLSSLAQIAAIVGNQKLSKKEKSFLIPQEAFDGAVNVGLFLTLTQAFKSGMTKLIENGHIKFANTAKDYKAPMVTIASIVGSVVACNIITPLVRNYLGARVQKRIIDNHLNPVYNNPYIALQNNNSTHIVKPLVKTSSTFIYPTTMGVGKI